MLAKRWVRRSIAALSTAIILAIGAYSAFWLYAAHQIESELAAMAAAAKARKIELSWQDLRVGGYPLDFRVEATGLHVVVATPAVEVTAPLLAGITKPFDFARWQINLPSGFKATIRSGAKPLGKLDAENAIGAALAHSDGSSKVWLILGKSQAVTVASANPVSLDEVLTWLILPPRPPLAATDPSFSFAAQLRGIGISAAPPPFSNNIDDLAIGFELLGPIPDKSAEEAMREWRQAGGAIKFNHCDLSWDNLRISAKGDATLDADLQPVGSISATIAGYDQLLTALSVAGLLPADDLTPMKIGLAMLGPAISTYFTIKNGDMFLGPAGLGKVPRIDWK